MRRIAAAIRSARPHEPPSALHCRRRRPGTYPGLELLATAVLLLTEKLEVCYANPAAENLFELSRRQLLGNSARTLFGEAPALFQAIDKALASGASYTEQELELGVTGKPRLHLSCTVSVIEARDATLLLEFRHIDQQLKIAREERLLEQQQANRELIRSLAHEIKNPLGGIRGAAQLLERELDRPPLIEYTQVIIGEADRLQTLVNRLLTPHRLPTYRRTNIHELLARVAQRRAGRVSRRRDALGLRHQPAGIRSRPRAAHPGGAQHREERGTGAANGNGGGARSRITTRVARGVTLAKRRYRLALAVSVEDNGPGIPDELRDRIFYPLVSGREGGSGWASRSRRRSSPSTMARSNARARRDARCSPSCCRWNSTVPARRVRKASIRHARL